MSDSTPTPAEPHRYTYPRVTSRSSYEEVVAEFTARPLVPGETDADRARRAGGRVFPSALDNLPVESADDHNLRWCRAAAWARRQTLGPWVQGVEFREAKCITALRDRIIEVGYQAAGDEYFAEAA